MEKYYPYPLIIIADRYSGVYSGGKFTAWNKDFDNIPYEIKGDDIEAFNFWEEYRENYDKNIFKYGVIGIGNTPDEAVDDLIKNLINKGFIRLKHYPYQHDFV